MIRRFPLAAVLEVDTAAKTAALLLAIPADDGEGDVVVSRQDITAKLTTDDKRRLRGRFIAAEPTEPADG
jgi:hypothetical protein